MSVLNYDPVDILNVPLEKNDAGASTIKEFLLTLLIKLITEGGSFNSKRPFGYSSWDTPILAGLIKSGYVHGAFDDNGDIELVDESTAGEIILEAIQYLGQ